MFFETLFDTLEDYLGNLPFAAANIAIVVALLFLLWATLDRISPFNDDTELFDKENVAYMLQRLGFVLAMMIGLQHSFTPDDEISRGESLFWLGVEGLWIYLALVLVARPIADRVIMPKVDNLQALKQGNVAVGIVEFGFYVGFGFILNGSMDGEADSVGQGFLAAMIFMLLGVALSVAVFYLHERWTPYSIKDCIEQIRLPGAIETAGVLIAIPVMVRIGVAGDFNGWTNAFAGFFATVAIAIPSVYAFRWVIDRFIAKSCTVNSVQRDNKTVAASTMTGLFVIMSFPVATALSTLL